MKSCQPHAYVIKKDGAILVDTTRILIIWEQLYNLLNVTHGTSLEGIEMHTADTELCPLGLTLYTELKIVLPDFIISHPN